MKLVNTQALLLTLQLRLCFVLSADHHAKRSFRSSPFLVDSGVHRVVSSSISLLDETTNKVTGTTRLLRLHQKKSKSSKSSKVVMAKRSKGSKSSKRGKSSMSSHKSNKQSSKSTTSSKMKSSSKDSRPRHTSEPTCGPSMTKPSKKSPETKTSKASSSAKGGMGQSSKNGGSNSGSSKSQSSKGKTSSKMAPSNPKEGRTSSKTTAPSTINLTPTRFPTRASSLEPSQSPSALPFPAPADHVPTKPSLRPVVATPVPSKLTSGSITDSSDNKTKSPSALPSAPGHAATVKPSSVATDMLRNTTSCRCDEKGNCLLQALAHGTDLNFCIFARDGLVFSGFREIKLVQDELVESLLDNDGIDDDDDDITKHGNASNNSTIVIADSCFGSPICMVRTAIPERFYEVGRAGTLKCQGIALVVSAHNNDNTNHSGSDGGDGGVRGGCGNKTATATTDDIADDDETLLQDKMPFGSDIALVIAEKNETGVNASDSESVYSNMNNNNMNMNDGDGGSPNSDNMKNGGGVSLASWLVPLLIVIALMVIGAYILWTRRKHDNDDDDGADHDE